MGQSTDALLFYGWDYEEGEEPEGLPDMWERADKEFGIEISSHCSGDCPMYLVAAKLIRAWRGDPKRNVLVEATATDTGEMQTRLRNFCAAMGIEYKEPSWILASDWC